MAKKTLADPEAYYEPKTGKFWVMKMTPTQACWDYAPLNPTMFSIYLRQIGYEREITKALTSPMEDAMMKVMMEKEVAYAGPLAGYQAGFNDLCGNPVLVTKNLLLPEPIEKMKFPTVEQMFDEQFGDQLDYLLGWIKIARQSLESGVFKPGQLLALAGPAGSGKSFTQKIITYLLGGRAAKPYRYMTGDTPFNSELFAAEHLMIEDEASKTDIQSRRMFGAMIKNFTVNETHSFHRKGQDAFTMPAIWRLSASLNPEPEYLTVIPPIDDSLRDKITLLKVSPSEVLQNVPDTAHARADFWDKIQMELHGLLYFIKKWRIPKALKDSRYGVRSYQHPDLLAALDELSPAQALLDLLEAAGVNKLGIWKGTAGELEKELRKADGLACDRLFKWSSACGGYLKQLSVKFPERFEKRTVQGQTKWVINPRPSDPSE